MRAASFAVAFVAVALLAGAGCARSPSASVSWPPVWPRPKQSAWEEAVHQWTLARRARSRFGGRPQQPGRRPRAFEANGTKPEREYEEARRLAPDDPSDPGEPRSLQGPAWRGCAGGRREGAPPFSPWSPGWARSAACGGGPVDVSLDLPGVAALPPGTFTEIIVTELRRGPRRRPTSPPGRSLPPISRSRSAALSRVRCRARRVPAEAAAGPAPAAFLARGRKRPRQAPCSSPGP
ncbi:MAG: hypothetical protein MZU95_13065 [Desulfomicrobium escambiense]|nr:hypothetical protein [Desulfomicrobium escambiense]